MAQSPAFNPSSVPLTRRQEAILRLIVQEYVATGRAVGSKGLSERYPLGVSPATVRNEMADLEAAGYVQHLHTSGGRIPTDQGYRYFVHRLLGNVELPTSEQMMISHQFRQVEVQLEQWVELAATVLAHAAGNISLVTVPRTATTRLRHLELIALQPRLGLLILVTADSAVRQVMVHWPEDTDQPALSLLADALSAELRGLTAEEIEATTTEDGLARFVVAQVAVALRGQDAVERTEVRHSGLEHILAQPEFSGAAAETQALLAMLRGGAFLNALLPSLERGREDVQVFIGAENPTTELRHLGVVVSTYGIDGEIAGVVGVVGPTRMAYGRTISSVRYVSRLMSNLMADLYGA